MAENKTQQKEAAKANEKAAEEEAAKLAGETDSQQELKKYHEGKFQTHDPVTGEKRPEKLPKRG